LYDQATVVHCIVIYDINRKQTFTYGPDRITDALVHLATADVLIGHNVIFYDIPVLTKLYPSFTHNARVIDTLVCTRLIWPKELLNDLDTEQYPQVPSKLRGSASLKAWGWRLADNKINFKDFSQYSEEMLEYCVQDVEVSVALSRLFEPKLKEYEQCITTEHELAKLMSWQEREGYPFDLKKAHDLEGRLRSELETLSEEMRSTFLFVDGGEFTPLRPNKTRGYVTGATFCRLKEFNPTSRQHIAWAFKQFRGWKPEEFTDTGVPKIDEDVLVNLGTKESKKFARILELQKHLGQLSEGQNAWLKKVEKDGRIHHSCVLNTNTGRMAHMKPNLAQVPSAHDYRELFVPGPKRAQVGADASGLELRCLAHYLARFDGGKFGKEVVEGDIHTALAEIYGTDRKTGKGVTYCLIYGGGDMKLGLTAGASKDRAISKGKEIRKRIMSDLDGFGQLTEAIQEKAKSGLIKGLDGRPIRLQGKSHAALNYLLQSAGAIICKRWVIRSNELLKEAGIDYWPLAFVHDEMQLSVDPAQAEQAAFLITRAMKDVESAISFRCKLDSEYKIGASWADTH
jgi:DNA polymerase I-like protein with 3'-5' exonuclease and polymerase domains